MWRKLSRMCMNKMEKFHLFKDEFLLENVNYDMYVNISGISKNDALVTTSNRQNLRCTKCIVVMLCCYFLNLCPVH